MTDEPAGQLAFDAVGEGITVRGNLDAYAATPGSGPDGETCRSCRHSVCNRPGNRRYWKCRLVRSTNSPATDIRLKTPACWRWEVNPEKNT